MDAFQALLSGGTPAPSKPANAFEALLAGQSDTSAALGEATEPRTPPAPPAPPKKSYPVGPVGETVADLGDIIVGGIPAMIVGTFGEVTNRLSAVADGRGWREGGKAGAEWSQWIGQKIGRPFHDFLMKEGLIDPENKTIPQDVMEKIGGWVEGKAEETERATGGWLSKEDYMAAFNGGMAAMGVKGLKASTQAGLNRAGAKSAGTAWDRTLARFEAEEALAKQSEAEGTAARVTDPVALARKTRIIGSEPVSVDTRTIGQRRRDAIAAFTSPEGEQLAASQVTYPDHHVPFVGPTVPEPGSPVWKTGSRDAILLDKDGRPTPTSNPHDQPFRTADMRAAERAGLDAAPPTGEAGTVRPIPASTLDSAITKVREKRLFDLTAEERIALRGSREITDPKIITAAAVGATGLGLAMLYEPSADEAAMAIGAGALLRRGGKGETMRELMARPEATPLGPLLEASPYTTSTLEKLANASPGRFEFKKAQIEQLLKQADVTKHERDVMQAVLDAVPRPTVTAKELMVSLKMAIEDFELGVEKVRDDLSSVGLERIDRASPDDYVKAQESDTQLDEPVTRLYKSPIRTSSNNHWSDPNYFGHTRSFVEDGIRHVVELQSDLDGRAKVSPPPEAIKLMLKDWWKRLIREEMADAARNLETAVRFATADTMAKVEGWPDSGEARRSQLAYVQSNLQSVKDHIASLEAMKRGEAPKDDYYSALKIADPEAYDRVVEHIDAEISYGQEMLREAQLRFDRVSSNWGDQPRFSKHVQPIYDRYARDIEKFLRQLGGKPYTDSAGHTWIEVPLGEQQRALPGGGARTQIGGIDPQLAKAAGLVGGAAVLASWLSSEKDKVRHAAAAAAVVGLGLYAKSRNPEIARIAQRAVETAQDLAGNISTDKVIGPALLRRLTQHELGSLKGIHDGIKAIAPFVHLLDKVPITARKAIDTALLNGSTPEILRAFGESATPGLVKAWEDVRTELARLGKEAVAVGKLKELRPNYFPRIVKDLPGLLKALGQEYAAPLQKALQEAADRAGGALDDLERAEVINKFIEKSVRQEAGGRPSFFKRRTIDGVTIDLAPYYVDPTQALPLYVSSVTRAVERAKFFGKDAVRDPVTGRPNLEASIGNVVLRELEAGRITPESFERLTGLLRSRFGPGEQAAGGFSQLVSQTASLTLLGNVFSGAMNLSDVGGIAARHGLLPVVKALEKQIRGKAEIRTADVGLAEAIGAEFVSGTRNPVYARIPFTQRQVQLSLARATDKTLKMAGFKAFDSVMKETMLNATQEAYRRMARTDRGVKTITKRYGDYFTTDLGQLLVDLREGKTTKLTTELAFRELSDAQPITKIEMPKYWLDHPNQRFMYALKSFMIKQLNFAKKHGVDEIRKGNVREGTEFLIRYGLMAGAAGATMDTIVKWMLGRESETDWKSVPLAALKNFGLSEYVLDKARQGKGKEAILATVAPPVDPILKILSADPEAVRYFPLVGRLVYDQAMDGAEKANAAKHAAERKAKADARRTPAERRELERRALERRKELLRERD